MTDILLIQPPIRDFYLTKKRTIPYGLINIAACLVTSGFRVELLDGLATLKSKVITTPIEMRYLLEYYGRQDRSPFCLFHQYRHYGYSFEHIGKTVRESGAFLVGIASLFTPYADMALHTAEVVKKNLPKCNVVMGGHHPTELPERVMNHPAVDFVIRGEGEKPMLALAKYLQNGKRRPNIPGVCHRNNDGTRNISDPVVTERLDELPMPAMQLLNWKHYMRGKRPGTTIVASRGCPFSCSYCAMGKSSATTYRRRAVENIIAEMDTAVSRYNCGFFDFEDENLSNDRQWFSTLLREITQKFGSRCIELRAMNGLFPPSLDEDLLPLMRDAGFRTLNLSLGTTSGRQLKRFGRPDVRASFERIVSRAGLHGLDCVGYIIVGAPYQDPQQSVDDLVYLLQRRVLAGVSVFYPAPGSADFRRCREMNLLPVKESLYRSSALPLNHTSSRLHTVTLLRLGRIANFIKHLEDGGHSLPSPKPCSQSRFELSTDRLETGRVLLQWFLFDGKIRGIDADGQVYEHRTSTDLTMRFIKKLV